MTPHSRKRQPRRARRGRWCIGALVVSATAVSAAGAAAEVSPTPTPQDVAGPLTRAESTRIVLPASGQVVSRVVSKDAGDTLAHGLSRPSRVVVCWSCEGGSSRTMGSFYRGVELVFFLADRTVDLRWSSRDAGHARVRAVSPTTWVIRWDDSGGCAPACPDGDFDDLVTRVTLVEAGRPGEG